MSPRWGKIAAVVTTLCVPISGCANWEQVHAIQKTRYTGKNIESVYRDLGVPTGVAPLRSGGKFMEFTFYRGGYRCETAMETDAKGVVTEVTGVSGQNGCAVGW
jgi:hypothetical protein